MLEAEWINTPATEPSPYAGRPCAVGPRSDGHHDAELQQICIIEKRAVFVSPYNSGDGHPDAELQQICVIEKHAVVASPHNSLARPGQ